MEKFKCVECGEEVIEGETFCEDCLYADDEKDEEDEE